MKKLALIVVCLVVPGAGAGEEIVPVFAHSWPGQGGNLWSSEIFVSNLGDEPASAHFRSLIPGFIAEPSDPCQVFVAPLISVPAGGATVWRSADIAFGLECSQQFIGALVIEVVGELRLESRMVNHRGDPAPEGFLRGYGQSFEPFVVADLAAGSYWLPGLVWHPNPCGPAQFSSFLGFVNPGDEPAQIEISGAGSKIFFEGELVELPFVTEIEAGSWRQVAIAPQPLPITACLPPELIDLRIDSDRPIAIYGSVVDRSKQDPRTVKALLR